MQLFSLKDKTGRTISLTKDRWRHITQAHPEMHNTLFRIEETLLRPLLVQPDEDDPSVHLYYRYYKECLPNAYLVVVAKYLNGEGFIITSFQTDKIK